MSLPTEISNVIGGRHRKPAGAATYHRINPADTEEVTADYPLSSAGSQPRLRYSPRAGASVAFQSAKALPAAVTAPQRGTDRAASRPRDRQAVLGGAR